jgi:hypothetical protein
MRTIRLLNSIGLSVNDRLAPGKAMRQVVPDVASGTVSPSKHALKESGGFDESARAREPCGFANYVTFQHHLHRPRNAAFLESRRGCRFTAGAPYFGGCKSP